MKIQNKGVIKGALFKLNKPESTYQFNKNTKTDTTANGSKLIFLLIIDSEYKQISTPNRQSELKIYIGVTQLQAEL